MYEDSAYYHLPREIISNHVSYSTDINSVEKMYNLINTKKIQNIIAVVTFEDSLIKNSINLAKLLKVKSLDISLLHLTDKSSITKIIPEYSPLTIRFNSKNIQYDKINNLLKDKEFILKPDYGSGSIGIVKISSPSDVEIINHYIKKYRWVSNWILQEKISGELYSIEGYCLDGNIHVIGYATRDRTQDIDMSNHFPIDDKIKPKIKNESIKALKSLVTRSDFKNGYFHCEFLFDGSKVYLIDANLGRIGGGPISEQLAISFGHKPEEIIAHVIAIGVFHKEFKGTTLLYTSKPRDTLGLNYGIERKNGFKKLYLPNKMKSYNTTVINSSIASILSKDSRYLWVGVLSGLKEEVLLDINNIKILIDNNNIVKPSYFLVSDYSKSLLMLP